MARNEEKQLARLNRFYLQQQKEEDLKKRPPRPRLDSLQTPDEIKKWLPSILRDIDFYVKQMEVPCYPQRQIDEFSRRLDGLRGEYKAYVRRLRSLQPDLTATPWTDRPYEPKKRKKETTHTEHDSEPAIPPESPVAADLQLTKSNFTPLSTPILEKAKVYETCFGYQKPTQPEHCNVDEEAQDRPLDFQFAVTPSAQFTITHTELPDQDKPLDFKSAIATRRKSSNKIHTLDDNTALDSVKNSKQTSYSDLDKLHSEEVSFEELEKNKVILDSKKSVSMDIQSTHSVSSEQNRLSYVGECEKTSIFSTTSLPHISKCEKDTRIRTETLDCENTFERGVCGEQSKNCAENSQIDGPTDSSSCGNTLGLPYSDSSSSEPEDS